MRRIQVGFLGGLLSVLPFMQACQDQELANQLEELSEELEEAKQINNLLAFRQTILDARVSEVLVSNVAEEPNGEWNLSFEDGSVYQVDSGIVAEVALDSASWKVDFTLSDASEVSGHFIGNLSITEEQIELNPFNSAPLSALAQVSTPVKGSFVVTVKGQDGDVSDIIYESPNVGTEHSLPIIGLYGEYDNTVELTFVSATGAVRATHTTTVTTEALPTGLPTVDIVVPLSNPAQNTLFLVNYRAVNMPFMMDAFGKVRWFSNGFTTVRKYGLQIFANGNVGYGVAGAGQGSVMEYTLVGEFVREYTFYPAYENAHHDVFELPNGNLLVAVNETGGETIEDQIIEMDRNSGAILTEWDLRESLPTDRLTFRVIQDGADWFHNNAIWYDERDHSLILSGQAQGVVKVDWDNNLKWILAPHEGWPEEYQDYLLQPTEAEGFEWVWGQHAPQVLPSGNLLLFDNGFGREFGAADQFSRAVEFEIVENDNGIGGSISEVWQYGKERGEEFFAPFISDVDYYPTTDTRFLVAGSTAFSLNYVDSANMTLTPDPTAIETIMVEVNEAKEVLFEATFSSEGKTGTTYRAEKLILFN